MGDHSHHASDAHRTRNDIANAFAPWESEAVVRRASMERTSIYPVGRLSFRIVIGPISALVLYPAVRR